MYTKQASRARDERVLEFINVFDEAMSRKGLVPGTSDFTSGSSSGSSIPGSVKSTPISSAEDVALSRAKKAEARSVSIAALRESLAEKSNPELASEAGSAARKTGTALVAVTSR
jgi:hypothetical protein